MSSPDPNTILTLLDLAELPSANLDRVLYQGFRLFAGMPDISQIGPLAFTSDTHAAEKLTRYMLPDWTVITTQGDGHLVAVARLAPPASSGLGYALAAAPAGNPALALCRALVAAVANNYERLAHRPVAFQN